MDARHSEWNVAANPVSPSLRSLHCRPASVYKGTKPATRRVAARSRDHRIAAKAATSLKLDNVVYVSEMKNWEQMTVRRSFDQLVGTLRALLDPAASRTLEAVRYQPKENTFFVAFRNGKTYELPRKPVEVDDGSPLVGEPGIIHGGSAFEIRQQSGNTYQVPWDLVLYHQEPSYPYHKGKADQRGTETHRAERIGARVRQEREGRGWSLAELARRTGIQPPNLSRLENGKHVPSLDTLQRVADALGVRVADLVAA